MKPQSKVRNSAFEILRLVAIVFIIISHYCIGTRDNANILTSNLILVNNLCLGDVGVAIFMFISGFFLWKSEKIDPWHIVKIVLEYYFYSFLCYGLSFVLIKGKSFDADEFLRVSLGLFYERAWFVSAYLLVYIFHPFINRLFKLENFKLAVKFMVIITIVWSIIPSFTAGTFYLNRFTSLLCLYCYGAFLRLSKESSMRWYNKKTGLMLFLISLGVIATYQLIMSIVTINHRDMAYMISWFISRHSIFMIPCVFGLMMLVSFAKPIYSRPINFIAGFTLGIYLIHENDALRNYYWNTLFRSQDYCNSNAMLWHVLMSVALVFFICLAIDILRKYALENPLIALLKKVFKKKEKEKIAEA